MPSWMRLIVAAASGMLLALRAPVIHAVDCNQNRVEDAIDLETGASPDCNRNLVPDECDVLPVSYGLALDREIALDLQPDAILAKDFDGDGHPDLVATHDFRTDVTVLWNDGVGGFGERSVLMTQSPSDLVREADLEEDGDLDLVLVGSTEFSFFRNDGGRVFSRAPGPLLDFPARSIVLADLDLDGDADLAAAGPFEVSVLLQMDAGVFEESEAFPVGSNPGSIVAADLDGDRDIDLATGNSFGNVSILLNRGAGLYAVPRNYAAGGSSTRGLKVVDLDGDGDADLVTIVTGPSGGDNEVVVLENAGDASFRAGTPVPILVEAVAIIHGDVDDDGDIDLVLPSTWIAFVQNHGGVLGPAELFPGEIAPRSAVASDVDGDGSLDLVEAQYLPRISILESVPWRNRPDCNADGVPDDCQLTGNDCNENDLPDDCDIASGRSRDCNANGKPDHCETDCNKNVTPDDCDLAARTSADCNENGVPDECDPRPDVRLEPPREIDRFAIHRSLRIADLDGDGKLDLLALIDPHPPTMLRQFLNSGNGTFEVGVDQALSRRPQSIVFTDDIEGDGDPDLLLTTGGLVSVMFNDGSGRFESGPVVESVDILAASGGDMDGDGDFDLVLGKPPGGATVHLFSGGMFEPASELPASQGASALIAGDFDSDGDVDVAGVLQGTTVIRTFLNDGAAGFPSSRDSRGGNRHSLFTAADLDGDGHLDLVEQGRTAPPALGIHLNRGDGRFADVVPIVLEAQFVAVATSDLDGDGDADLAVSIDGRDSFPPECSLPPPASVLSFRMNDGEAGFATSAGVLVERMSVPHSVEAGDLDGDGLDDAAMLVFPECPCCIGPTETSIHVVLNRTTAASSRDGNRNRVPDECEGPPFRRGDSSADGRFDITDALTVLLHLFQGGPAPTCASAADSNDDAKIDVTDPIYFLVWLFGGGPSPPHPGATCGHDPDPPGTEGNLGCTFYEGC